MKLKSMQTFLLIVLASFLLTACGGGGSSSGGGSVTVSAQVDTSTYTVVPTPTWLDKVYTLFGGETVYALGTGVVNQVVAIASYKGAVVLDNMITANIASDGSFSLSLDRSYEWVLLLVNTEATEKFERVVSYVATKVTDTDNLVAYSGTSLTSNLALGILVNQGEEAVGTSDLLAFNLDVDELVSVAQADNGYKHMINAYLNYDPATGRSYGIAPIFAFNAGDIETFYTPPVSSQIEAYQTVGLSFFLENVDLEYPESPGVVEDLCKGLGDFGLYPPGPISDADGKLYDSTKGVENDASNLDSAGFPDDELTNMGVDLGPWDDGCYDSDMGIRFPGYTPRHVFMGLKTAAAQFQIPVDGMPAGHWKLKAGLDGQEEVIAEFDLEVSSPIDASGHLNIPVPAIEVISDQDGKITTINTSWFVYSSTANNDAGGYVKLTGRNALAVNSLVSGSFVTVQDEDGPTPAIDFANSNYDVNVFLKDPEKYNDGVGGTPYPHKSEGLWTTPIVFPSEASEEPSWYVPGHENSNDGVLAPTHIRVDLEMGGIQYQFSFNGPHYMPQ